MNTGSEIYIRLQNWQEGDTASERLVAALLQSEGYEVDPAHPLGGRDGGQDAILKKDEKNL